MGEWVQVRVLIREKPQSRLLINEFIKEDPPLCLTRAITSL